MTSIIDKSETNIGIVNDVNELGMILRHWCANKSYATWIKAFMENRLWAAYVDLNGVCEYTSDAVSSYYAKRHGIVCTERVIVCAFIVAARETAWMDIICPRDIYPIIIPKVYKQYVNRVETVVHVNRKFQFRFHNVFTGIPNMVIDSDTDE